MLAGLLKTHVCKPVILISCQLTKSDCLAGNDHLNGILCHERDLKITKAFVSANPANIFERFEARRQEDLNLRPLA